MKELNLGWREGWEAPAENCFNRNLMGKKNLQIELCIFYWKPDGKETFYPWKICIFVLQLHRAAFCLDELESAPCGTGSSQV